MAVIEKLKMFVVQEPVVAASCLIAGVDFGDNIAGLRILNCNSHILIPRRGLHGDNIAGLGSGCWYDCQTTSFACVNLNASMKNFSMFICTLVQITAESSQNQAMDTGIGVYHRKTSRGLPKVKPGGG
ncbi:unnamed protein product [Ilex paraguariensis]|uniref:Uncharacterized protein n=1 Tax=Ilex paraguariensis TaxID=185542 RepID=A0ABC8SCY2_9AQUA